MAAGPDGSVHLIDQAGKTVDAFNSGTMLRGIASVWDGSTPLVLLSDEKGVRASGARTDRGQACGSDLARRQAAGERGPNEVKSKFVLLSR
ncbi:MAG: hypothetical protein QM811_01700 [Pirellulales bacterium]